MPNTGMKGTRKGTRVFSYVSLAIGLLSALTGICLYTWNPAFLREIDLRYGDLRFKMRGTVEPNPQVAIVAIDEKSINELGRWPWSRHRLAELLNRLTDYRPRVVAFDILFSEPESVNADAALGEAVEKNGNVVLGYFFRKDATEKPTPSTLKELENSSIKLIKFLGQPKGEFLTRFDSADLNISEIGAHAGGFGFFNAFPDTDGVVRRAQMLIEYKDKIYPSLNLEGIRSYLGQDMLLQVASYGVEVLYIGQEPIPVDEKAQFLINYYGPHGIFPIYSAVDVISGEVPEDALRDKLVFVGATEIGISDVKPTAFDPVLPGVEIHATVAGNILDGRFLIKNTLTRALDLALILILPMVLVWLLMRVQKTFIAFVIFVAAVLFHTLVNYLFFTKLNLLLSFIYPGLSLALAYVLFEGYRNIVVERRNRYLRMAFSTYVSPELVAGILQDPDKLKLGGEKRSITVLFSDIRNFTYFSEKIPPEMLVTILNEYLNPMTQIVMKERGTLDKYIGDAIMAIFGAPLDVPDHPKRACQAALYMLEKLEKLNIEWSKKGWPHISIGIGINTGEAIVGNMGANVRFDYTAIGDTVNLASRLEGLNKIYGTEIILSKSTLDSIESAEPAFLVRELDLVQVKGKEKPIPVFQLIDFYPGNLKQRTLVKFFSEALSLFRERSFQKARDKFADILGTFPDDVPSIVYFERCSQYITQPPPAEWEGVYIAKEK